MTSPTADSIDLFPRHELGLHQLRRLRAGELEAVAAERARAHLAGCAQCRARLTELESEDRQARESLPFDAMADRLARRASARPRWQRAVPAVSLALAAGLAAVVVLPRAHLFSTPRSNGLKGGGSDLSLYVGGVSEPRRVQGEAQLQPGERVRLQVDSSDHGFLAVLSIDEEGTVTPLYPPQGESQPVQRGPGQMLPQSIDFFGSGRERLVAIFSNSPLRVTELVATAQEQFHKAGSLAAMGSLGLGEEEIDRTVVKSGVR